MVSKKKTANKQKNQKKKKTTRRAAKRVSVLPAWYAALADPFNHTPVAVPDSATAPSMKVQFFDSITFNTYDIDASLQHGILLGITPVLKAVTNGGTGSYVSWHQYKSLTNNFPNGVSLQPIADRPPAFASAFSQQPVGGGITADYMWMYRTTAFGIKLRYLGTELDRAGEVDFIQAFPIAFESITECDAETLSYGYNRGAPSAKSPADIINRGKRVAFARTEDGTFTCNLLPSGVPSYHPLVSTSGTDQSKNYIDPVWPNLFIMILGDKTDVAQNAGNQWALEICQHLEIRPATRYGSCIPVTPSPCDYRALQECLNMLECMSTTYSTQGPIADGAQTSSGYAWEATKNVTTGLYNSVVGAFQTDLGKRAIQIGARAGVNWAYNRQFVRNGISDRFAALGAPDL